MEPDKRPTVSPYKEQAKKRETTLRERLEEYEKEHRALWQECKNDLESMLNDSED